MRFKLFGAQTRLNRHFRIDIKPLFWQSGNDRIPVAECFGHSVSVDLTLNQIICNVRSYIIKNRIAEKRVSSDLRVESLVVINNDQFPLSRLSEQIGITTVLRKAPVAV